MRTCFSCGDEIAYNDSGTNQFMVCGWIRPYLSLEWKKVVLNVTIMTESLDDPHICLECVSNVYTRLGKNEEDGAFRNQHSTSDIWL